MDKLDSLIMRARYALQFLSDNQQRDLVEFIEQYATHYEGREIFNIEHTETEVVDVKQIN